MKEVLEDGMINYSIISCNQKDLKSRRLELENDLKTKSIIYPDGSHECVRIILERIVEIINPEAYSSITVSKSAQSVNTNRFKYNSESCEFYGRDNEIKQLIEFCCSPDTFSWWSITGEGGSGKTRLAWEFEKLIKNKQISNMQNWNVAWNLPDKQENNSMDTLIIIDYAKSDSGNIAHFINTKQNTSSSFKFRLLLIDRDDINLYEAIKNNIKSISTLKDLFFRKDSLSLKPINDEDLKNIVDSYAKKREYKLEDKDLKNILDTCKKVDSQLKRPLYALFVADALINEHNITLWDRKHALDYVYDKECHEIQNVLSDVFGRENPIAQRNLFFILLFINFSSLHSLTLIEDILIDEVSELRQQLKNVGYLVEDLFKKINLLNEKNELIIIEPHIIGEYFIIKQMSNIKNNEDIVDFLSTVWNNTFLQQNSRPFEVIERLYNDFEDLLENSNLKKYFENIEISNKQTSINNEAFWGHHHLKSITIGKNISKIGTDAFSGCSNLEKIIVDKDNFAFASIDGVLFDKNITELIYYPSNKPDKCYKVPDTVQKISDNAFSYCNNLKSITLSNNLEEVTGCFYECRKIEQIILSKNIKLIGYGAFNGCENLKDMYIPQSVNTIQCTRFNPFNRCESLEKIDVDPANQNYFSHEGVLYNKLDKSLLVYPLAKKEQVYSIVEETLAIENNAFSQNNYICKVVIPNGVKNIGAMGFAFCQSLQIVSMADTVEFIDRFAFSGCYNLRNINLSKRLQDIKDELFIDCKSLVAIYIPPNVKRIEYQAFAGCDNLKEIEISNEVDSIEMGCFENCKSLEKISLPLSMKKINSRTFAYCTSLKDICVPNSIIEIDKDAFYQCHPQIHIRKDNQYFAEQVGQIFSWLKDDLYSINYILAENNVLINIKNEINGCKITKVIVTSKNKQYACDYWYKDKECTQKWDYDFDVMPDHDICLYVKLIKKTGSS